MKNKQATLTLIAVTFFTLCGVLLYSQVTDSYKDQAEVKAVSEHPEYIPSNYQNLGQPQSILVLPDGNLWFIDPLNGRIVLITQAGEILRTVGRYGTGEGEFDGWVTSMTRDTQGNLYVLTGGHVYKLDSNGGFIMSWDGGDAGQYFSNASSIYYDAFSSSLVISDKDNSRIKKYTTTGTFVLQFGSAGSGDGQFLDAQGVTTDSNGRIFVVDSQPNCRVEAFSPEGTFLFKFGSCGSGDGLLTVPMGIKVRANGDIIVASAHTNSLQEFDSNGNWIRTFADYGDNVWQFASPFAVDFDSAGNYYLIDHYHKAIQKYSSNRVFISGIRNSGFVGGKLTNPTSVAYDSVGNLYVLDNGAYNGRIQKFTNAGTYISTIVQPPTFGYEAYYMTIKNDEIYVADHTSFKKFDLAGNMLMNIGTEGTGDGQFIGARGIAVDSQGNIYVTDASNHRVQKFDAAGNYLLQWGSLGTGNGQFAVPTAAIVIDSSDNIYVPDNQNNYEPDILQGNTRIQVFNTSGVYLRTIGSFGDADGQMVDIGGIVIDAAGQLHVSETNGNNPKIQIFTTDGTYVGKYGRVGSGMEEYVEPRGLGLNPITNNISVVDSWSHRVQVLNGGTRIVNLISSADVARTADNASLVKRYYDPLAVGISNISSRLYYGDYVVSEFNVNLTSERNWQQVRLNTLPGESKTLVTNLTPSGAPGISATHSIFLVKQPGQTSVHVCPDAAVIADITANCANGYDLTEGEASNLSTVVIDTISYWKITGLTGTGAYSVTQAPSPTPTAAPTSTATPTATATATPTPTATTTVTATPSPTPTKLPIAITTLLPVTNQETPACPTFEEFTTSTTFVKQGEPVMFTWTAKNTEAVRISLSDKSFNPVDTYTVIPLQTTVYSFTADNGRCNAKKQVTINVVESLPWVNSLAVGAGALAVEAVVATQLTTVSFGNLWLAAAAFIDRRKKRSWGYVYNAVTKKPLSRAVIRLMKKSNGEIIDTVVSDATGAFRLSPRMGEYRINVKHPQFTFPSKIVTTDVDGGYSGIYHGGDISIKSASAGILLSIPLDPYKPNEEQKTRQMLIEGLVAFGTFMSNVVMLGGLAYTMYCAVVYPHIYNYLMLGVYFLIVCAKTALTVMKPKIQGKVTTTAGKPVAGLELGLYDTDFKNLLYRTFTTADGHYSFAVMNTGYKLKVLDDKYQLTSNGVTVQELRITPTKAHDTTRLITDDLTIRVK